MDINQEKIINKIKVLCVADRPGWSIDRLSKPLSEIYENVTQSYFNTSPNRYLDSGYSDWKTSTQYCRKMADDYDVVHFHRLEAAVASGLEGIKAKKILTVHTGRHADWEDERLLQFDDLIAPTQDVYNHFLEHFKDRVVKTKVHFIYHGIELRKYYPEEKMSRDGLTLGYVGRIVDWKRWDRMQLIANTGNLKLIGCGYVEKGSLYNRHNVPKSCFTYTDFLPEPQMRNFYNRMNLFLCFSEKYVEAGPLPVMEAMACGTPVLSTKQGWAIDHCEGGKNIIFIDDEELTNTGKLTNKIKKIMADKKFLDEIRNNALELIKNFSIENYAKNLMNIYAVK